MSSRCLLYRKPDSDSWKKTHVPEHLETGDVFQVIRTWHERELDLSGNLVSQKDQFLVVGGKKEFVVGNSTLEKFLLYHFRAVDKEGQYIFR